MNTSHRRIAATIAGLALPLLFAAQPAAAQRTACEIADAPSLDARLAAKAEQGPASLRRYLTNTQTIYGLDMPTAVARVERFRRTRAACAASSAP